jgi:hypothetical protein
MSPHDFTAAQIAERDQVWATINEDLDGVLGLLREHRKTCVSPSQFCIGIDDGAPDLAAAMTGWAMAGPAAAFLAHAAMARILEMEGQRMLDALEDHERRPNHDR